jgi:hypothetical protein
LTNEDCKIIDNLSGTSKTFYSTDILEKNASTRDEINNFPVEFFNSIDVSDLPSH